MSFPLLLFSFDSQAQTVDICSRTSQVQEAILAELPSGTACEAVPPAQLAVIKALNLDNKGISSLIEGDFDGLTGMSDLDLSRNNLASLEAGLFDGLTNLESVYVSNNSLTSLGEDLFDGLTKLRILYLDGNSLTSLDEDLFDGLTTLRTLDLGDNSLTSLDDDLFDDLTILEKLWLNGNSLTSLHEDQFDGLIRLDRLYLNENKLTSLDEDLFDGLTNLIEVHLRSNSLTGLEADLFDGLTNLEELRLGSNKLASLDADQFDGLTKLESLYLSNNDLTSLNADLFDGLTSLTALGLNGNDLASLNEDLFDGLTNLGDLRLHNNKLTSLEEDLFDGLTSLRNLFVSSNDLTSLNADLFDGLTSLINLNIGDNDLTSLDTDLFDGLTSLVNMTIGNNDLGSLDMDLFDGLTNLKNLSIRTAGLTELHENLFDHVTSPQALSVDLTGNNILCFPSSIIDNSAITLIHPNKDRKCVIGTLSLSLSSASIGEKGGTARVTASLDQASGAVTTITVSATHASSVSDSDYALSSNTTLTIAAGATTSTGTVTITAVDNLTDAPNKMVTVKGEASNTQGVMGPEDVTLTITDDDDTPTVALSLSPASISENGGSTLVTASLNRPSSEVTTVEISATHAPPVSDSDYTLSDNTTLTIAAGATVSTGEVKITAANNEIVAPDKMVTVKGAASNTQGFTGPEDVSLVITDDDEPTVTLALSSTSISENGGSATVSASLDQASSVVTTVTVSVSHASPVEASDYALSSNTTLTIAAGATASTGEVKITAANNETDAPDKTVTVQGVASNTQGIIDPANLELMITDDDDSPAVTLSLSSESISENGGSTTVTASLDRPSSEATTVEISASHALPVDDSDYALSSNTTLTIAAGAITSTGEVKITAANNETDAPDKTVTVQGVASNTQGITDPANLTLMITDDDDAPTVSLSLSSTSVIENGGSTTVTASLDRPSSEITTVTVSATHTSPVEASDYTLSSNTTLTIAAGATTSTGEVKITAANNESDTPDKTVTVQGAASNTQGIMGPEIVTLMITDDDDAPTVSLSLSSTSISENGGSTTVTASLDQPSGAVTTVTVSVAHVTPVEESDYALSTNTTLTIAAGATTSTGEVEITAANNETDAPDKTVTVQGVAANTQGITGPENVTLMITDDDDAPTVSLSLSSTSISENGGSATVMANLDRPSGEVTTVSISASHVSPVGDSDYALSTNTTLTIAAGAITSTGEVTITAADNTTDAPDKMVTLHGDASNTQGITDPANLTLMITDEDAAPTVSLSLSSTPISENGGSAIVTASLDHPSSEVTTVEISATHVSPVDESDYALGSNTTLTIAAGAITSTGEVTITATDNDTDAADKTVTVQGAASNPQGITNPANVILMITDEDGPPTVRLALSSTSISENGGSTTVTATLDRPSGEVTTVTVSASHVSPVEDSDYALSTNAVLTIAAGAITSTGEVTITAADNDVNAADKTVSIQGTATNTQGVIDPVDVTLIITNDDTTIPTVRLVLSPTSISENGGSTTVTATLNPVSSAETTIAVSAVPQTGASESDYILSTNSTLTIAAGEAASTGEVTITAADNDTDAPDKQVTVQGVATNTQSITGPADATLTITDEDDAPTVTLSLSPPSISENSGRTTVTATLDRPSSELTTVTVSAVPQTGVSESDYTLSTNSTLTIAAGQTESTGEVTIIASDNDVDAPNKTITVQGTAVNSQGISGPADVLLTIIDDDAVPTVTLSLSPAFISENGGSTSVTATLDRPSSEATTVTISSTPEAGASTLDYALSTNTTLTIAAEQTTSTGIVTITAVDNDVDAPDKTVTVQGAAVNVQGITDPVGVTLTITDDEATPTVTLSLSSNSINENGGSTTVIAILDRPSGAVTTVTVSATPQAGTSVSDYALSDNTTLTIAAGQTSSTGAVTITAVDNDVFNPTKSVTVQGEAANTQGVTDPEDVTLTITDDDGPPTVTLLLSPASISENAGSTTVTASLNRPSGAATTVTISVTHESPVSASDYMLSDNTTLTIAAGETASTGEVTITTVDNGVNAPDKTVTIQGTATNTEGITGPAGVVLTITDDDGPPTVTLALSPASISENGGSTTVTASLNRPSGVVTTVTILAGHASPVNVSDYRLSDNTMLTIAAGETASMGTVTIIAMDNHVDAPDKTVTVQGVAANAEGVDGPADVMLTITDDDGSPTVTLLLSPASISENGGSTTVTASLDRPSSAVTTVTISATHVSPAIASDYMLGDNTMLTIAAGETASTGKVTITAVDNNVDAPDKTVTVQGAAVNPQGVSDPKDVMLIITDDDASPTVTMKLSSGSIHENGGSTTVTASLDRPSSAVTTVTISATHESPVSVSDYMLSDNATLTIVAGEIASTGDVTITAVDNNVDSPDKMVMVQGVVTNAEGITGPTEVVLIITDDDASPTVTMKLSSTSIHENGGSTTVTASLDRPSSAVTTVTVSAMPQSPATSSDYILSNNTTLTIAAGETESTGDVTMTAVNNNMVAPDKVVILQGEVTNSQGVVGPAQLSVTITDEDSFPTAINVTVTATEDTPYEFGVMDFGYHDPEGDPLAGVRIAMLPDAGRLTLDRTPVEANTLVTAAQVSAGELVFTPAANAYGLPYTSFLFRVSDGGSESLSAATLTIEVTPSNDAATGMPLIVGSMQVGTELHVSTAEIMDADGKEGAERGIPGHAYSYQWLRMEEHEVAPIAGANSGVYAPVEADAGLALAVRVEFVDDSGFMEVLESVPRQVLYTRKIRQAWMGRFGRVVADQILEATECDGRLSSGRQNGARLAGQPLHLSSLPRYLRMREVEQDPLGVSDPVYRLGHTLTRDNLVRNSSFVHATRQSGGSGVALWGRGAVSRFRGREQTMDLDGGVASGMLAADWVGSRGTLGVLMAHTRSQGEYNLTAEQGALSGQLSGIYPNGCIVLASGLTAWGVGGYGRGKLTVEQPETGPFSSPMELLMAGGGMYGRIRTARKRGLELGLHSDALIVRTSAKETAELLQDVAQVTRLRLGLKGTLRGLRLGRHTTVEPMVEMALRHDGGDAETGFGMDMRVGMALVARGGLRMEVTARGILTHQDSGLQEQGMSGFVAWDSRPQSENGFQIRLKQTVGESMIGGTERLLRAEIMEPPGEYGFQTGEFSMEAGYGFSAWTGRLILQPEIGLEWGNHRRYEMGWEVALAREYLTDLRLFIGATGRDARSGGIEFQHLMRLQLNRQF